MEIRAGDVPEWIRNGELYRTMNPNNDEPQFTTFSGSDMSFTFMISQYNVGNLRKSIEFMIED